MRLKTARTGVLWVCFAMLWQAACTSGGSAPIPSTIGPRDDAGPTEKDSGSTNGGGGTGEEDAGIPDAASPKPDAAMSAGPLIEILTPTAAADPSVDPVVTGFTLMVTCRVTQANADALVDPKSVKVTVLNRGNMLAQQAMITQGDDHYTASIGLEEAVSGTLQVRCSASDTATPVNTNQKEIGTYFDQGPKVSFLEPLDGAPVQATVPATVQFRVAPEKLTPEDTGAEIDTVSLRIAGVAVAPQLMATDATSKTYEYDIDFEDPDIFPTGIVQEVSIEVDAVNKRAPSPVSRFASITVFVDQAGPTIAISKPLDQSIVGGEVSLTATIKDALSGVNDSSVRAEIQVGGTTDVYPLKPTGKDVYGGLFQAGKYPGRSQLTLNFIATDKFGTETRVEETVYLDTVPPWVSLDPPLVREAYGTALPLSCSVPFDPVGEAAVSDLDSVPIQARFRAIIWERTVQNPGATILYYSMVNNATAALYIQGDLTVPLLIDTNSDGVCDSVNSDPAAPALDPIKLDLAPIAPTSAAMPKETKVDALLNTPAVAGECTTSNAAGTAPPYMCTAESDLRKVIRHDMTGTVPAVYGFNPASGAALGCTGRPWEATVAGGWTCAVATARDGVGNLGISAPVRVCYEVQAGSGQCDNPGPPPSCTDGCTMPGIFTSVGMPLVLGPR